MSFEYNGFIHRDLEPQVRYDAEQVQLLKQADVTINENLQTVNENLQTINTEINGKLTKPANPSAESAVTMLADGTVGTKPLSEIGGGGKLYRHNIFIPVEDIGVFLTFYVYNKSNVKLTLNDIAGKYFVASTGNSISAGVLNCFINQSDLKLKLQGVLVNDMDSTSLNINERVASGGYFLQDTVTEL